MDVRLAAPPKPRRRKRWLILGAILVLAAGGTIAWQFAGPAIQLHRAEQALSRSDLLDAKSRLDRLRERRPTDERVLFLSAQVARRTADCAEAERLLTEYERQFGPTPESEFEWTLLGVQQADFAGQEESLRARIEREPAEAIVILEALAKGYDAAFRYPDALAALSKLAVAEPDNVPALILSGLVLDRQRQAEPAERALRRAVELAPDNASASAALADVLNRHGRTREAIHFYERALLARPNDATLTIGLTRALADNADLAGAERRLDDLLALNPKHADALVERGRLAIRRKQFVAADTFLSRAVQVAPWHRECQTLRLIALKQLNQPDDVAACETRIAALRAEDGLAGRLRIRARDSVLDAAVRWELWQWAVRNGQPEEGIAWLAEILRAEPNHAKAHAAFAEHFDRLGQPRRAAQHRTAAGGTS